MANQEITEIKRIFTSRLDVLDHILSVGEKHISDSAALMQERLAEDMHPFGAQVALVCSQPLGFAQWCASQPIENPSKEIDSPEQARALIQQTREMVDGISVDDSKLDEVKRIGLGPDRYAELPARQYLNDYLVPNVYFHISMAYAILRKLGAPIGKADYMTYLAPHVKQA
ncbi:DUF1993 domain-containing protein [Microbulbifer bruguierae]|uniref:DUF1993 domain-containing protein n=1 Tax=Microbulbifer bruguierae TaxID=3029061 RepID=A0ABY8NAQ1_9GAMM|nr:DUF1993 domain-containing protein [Microbulbifer bruguierae]WGL15883.1 DUF1993 domain-containing protein [Microbulbifer bruguierae]